MADTSNKELYWASLPPEQLAPEISNKVEEYFRFLETSGLLRKYLKSHNYYYGNNADGAFQSSSDVSFGGEEGELSMVKINNYRLNLQHVLVMTTQSRPALEARAINTDRKSKEQTILANGIVDYYLRDKRIERNLKIACEQALIWGEGYVELNWDTNQGAQYGIDPVTQRVIHEGDIQYRNPMGPLEVIRDVYAKEYDPKDWKIVIEWVNKFDLIAQYPEFKDAILAQSISLADSKFSRLAAMAQYESGTKIPIKKLMHPVSPAMPDGRLAIQLDSKTILFDGPMPYQNLPNGMPLYRITPAEYFGLPFGYTHAWDSLGLSEVTNALYSTVVTNQTAFGVQNIAVPRGHDLSYQQLTGGLNLIEYDPKLGKPEPLQLTKTASEIFNFLEKTEKQQGLLMGVNDVIKGDPQASLESGSALALVASQAIQFNSGLQGSYVALLEDVGTATIRMLQTFANTKRVASIAGKSERFMLKEFSAEDINNVNRFVVDVSNPLTQTIEGRVKMADDMIKMQVPGFSVDEYIQVVETGNYRPAIEDRENELLTIDEEKEMLAEGLKPVAIMTDDHKLHIKAHKGVLSMSDARKDQNVVKATLDHIQEHINLLTNTDPRILIMTGQQPLPAPPPPGAPPTPPPSAPMPPPHNPANGPHAAPPHGPVVPPPNHQPQPPIQASSTPMGQMAGHVRQAQMPKNPLSGQRFSPTGGSTPQ